MKQLIQEEQKLCEQINQIKIELTDFGNKEKEGNDKITKLREQKKEFAKGLKDQVFKMN